MRRGAARRRPRANASRSRRPYLSSITSQPFVRNCASSSAARIPGMTRSRLWRLRSTIQRTLPSWRVSGSASASQMLPSSSSASPSSEMNRPPVDAAEARLDVAVGKRAEERRARPEPDRARSSSRPGTDPSSATDSSAARRSRAAASDTSGRAGRAGTRAHAAPATRAASPRRGHRASQVGEPQGRHERHHRRRRRLVAADLERVALRALPVRVVDDPHREPEHAPLDRRERREVSC